MSITRPLTDLLNALESCSAEHEEILDTDVREELATAVYDGFIAPQAGYELPDSFEMFSGEANRAVREALSDFLRVACPIANRLGWSEKQRQDAFQDLKATGKNGMTYDEFFGHVET